MLVDLIRHGEPVGGRRYRGQVDDPLSEKGWQQMEAAVREAPDWQHIITSPLSRCSVFAGSLGERLGVPVTEEPRFKEIGFGEWEGCTPDDLGLDDPGAIERFMNDPVNNRPKGAEALTDFVKRIEAAWHDLLTLHKDKYALVVAHAGVIRAIMALILEMPYASMYRLQVDNAAVSRIRIGDRCPDTVVFHNRTRF